jgi:formylglycine-generating enzyme required for sulfatase activity
MGLYRRAVREGAVTKSGWRLARAAVAAQLVGLGGCALVAGVGGLHERGAEVEGGQGDGGADAGSTEADALDTDAPDSGLDGTSGSDGASVVRNQCAPAGEGLTNCGADLESCCTSLPVTGGTYFRTYVNGGGGPTGTAAPATVSDFRLDKYEVTVGRFRRFVLAWNAGFRPAPGSGKHAHLNAGSGLAATGGGYELGWDAADDGNVSPTDANLTLDPVYATWTAAPGSNEQKPINRANFWEAYAFCIWDGGFLPTEAEWEYAAAGGSEEREYPWGAATPSVEYAIYGCNYGAGCGSSANIAPVGTAKAGAGKWGQVDLAGNLWEWNLDWSAAYGTCLDCVDVTAASSREVRGGACVLGAAYLLTPVRNDRVPSTRDGLIGFRCARAP